jgi:acyl-CoA synthetase (AMP-forming)/AMP-acid ligase II
MLNGAMKANKLAYIIKDSGASAVITHVSKKVEMGKAIKRAQKEPVVLWVGESAKDDLPGSDTWMWTDLVKGIKERKDQKTGKSHDKKPRIIDQDLATLIYTSGSTGDPKGVMSSHHNMVSAARSIITYLENREDDIVIVVLPLSFDYGLYQVIMAFLYGGTVVIERSFMFPVTVLESIEREGVTGFPIVPTIAAFLLKMENLSKYDLSSLRYMTNTGAALPVQHIKALRKIFPDVKMYSMFGLTECKRVCYLPPEEIDRIPGSVGKAMPNCEVFLIDENGDEIGPGEVGEMIVRGSNVMQGYWNAPELTGNTYREWRFPGEKLLFTGDFFKKDQNGFLYFLGRRDDMIKTKGERVSPKEVENVICSLDGISEAAVLGVNDELLGQAIKAYVVMKDGNLVEEKGVLRHCKENLEIWMVPKYVEFLNSLPKTPNGKVDKKALKELDV